MLPWFFVTLCIATPFKNITSYGECSSGVERRTVAADAGGSNPLTHPIYQPNSPTTQVNIALLALDRCLYSETHW